MTEHELIQQLFTLNESELFYRKYQEAKKTPYEWSRFLRYLNVDELSEKHLLVPEIKETIPPSMKDEFFYTDSQSGLALMKHNCYSPEFEHYHTFFEAFYVYEGTCVHEINHKRTVMRMGDFCIIPPGVPHSISVQDQSIIIVMIESIEVVENVFKNPQFFRDNVLSNFFIQNLRYSSKGSYLTCHTGNDKEMKDLIIQMMLESYNHYAEYDTVLTAYFSVFFGKLLRHYEKTFELSSTSDREEQGFRFITYIQENHTKVTLTDVAEFFHFSPEYTSRCIKATTGKTFSEIPLDSRMKHAASLLKSTVLPISEISFLVGYENTENFIKSFKKKYSKTPSQYRRELILEYAL
ncbi:MAG: helix-turn-helix domain-containing protein [Spirochaetales bacterium]|nr:helix-turn-helix domain-containing protein [Candidatus Physcosoma equi]